MTGVVDSLRRRGDTKFYQREVWEKRLPLWQEAADLDIPEAKFLLGLCASDGLGTPQDFVQAESLYRDAAEQGLAEAQMFLGTYLYFGRAGTKDYDEAVKWYRAAAEQGSFEAKCGLARCCLFGRGVEQDHEDAIGLLREAAEVEYGGAMIGLGDCYAAGIGVEEDLVEAATHYRAAAEFGHPRGMLAIGNCYHEGKGVEVDLAKAVDYWRQAAEWELAAAQFQLGQCYESGDGVDADPSEAAEWYRLAAEQGHHEAGQRRWALLLEEPERVWPITWAAIIVGSGTVLLLLWGLVFRGGSEPRQQADKDQPLLAAAQSAQSSASAPIPEGWELVPEPPTAQLAESRASAPAPQSSETSSRVFTQEVVEDLAAALDRGHVAPYEAASGTGASSGLAVDAYLINQRNTDVSLDISLRQPLFLRNRGRGQSMFVIKVYLRGGRYESDGFRSFISLQPKLLTPVQFVAYCADFDKDNPSNTEELVRDAPPVSLLPLLQSISNYESSHPNQDITIAAQAAIWLAQGVSIEEVRTKFEVDRDQELLAREFLK